MGISAATCPSCRTPLRLAQPLAAGTLIRCSKCAATFPLPPAAPPVALPVAPVVEAITSALPVAPPVASLASPSAGSQTAPMALPTSGPSFPKPGKQANKRVLLWVLGGVAVVLFLGVFVVVAAAAVLWRVASARGKTTPDTTFVAKGKTETRIARFQDVAAQPGPANLKKRDWLKRTLVDAYDRSGRKNLKWDAQARELLRLTADSWAQRSSRRPEDLTVLNAAFRKAEQAGCDDPLVLYAGGRLFDNSFRHDQAAQKMEGSPYHAAHRCYAMIRGFRWHAFQAPGPETIRQANRHRDAALKLLGETAKDKEVPVGIVLELCEQLEECYRTPQSDRKAVFDKINAELEQAAPGTSAVLTYQGVFNIHWAWDARGGGWANTVTQDGWRLFGQRLNDAATALEKAWELDPSNAEAATNMITVELGQGQGRPRMEKWFKRAINADPDNLTAYNHKLYYLEPKWHGSQEDMLAFGRECLQDGNWKARVPFILVDAHEALSKYNRADPNAYFMQPGVWGDLKSVYDPYLKTYPNSLGDRSRFTLYACRCGQWDEANRQFAQLGDNFDLRVFQNKTNYDQLRKEAASKAKRN
jgi:hypothetical protein